MRPGTRVSLGLIAGVCALVLIATFFADHWYHSAYDSPYLEDQVDWHGAGGPHSYEGILATATMVIFLIGAVLSGSCGVIVAIGTAAGSRRDHVPRLPALLAWTGALAVTLSQAIAVMGWEVSRLPEPKGVGWAMPAFFLAAPALSAASLLLWRDASRRARASRAALAKVDRELAARDLASLPEGAAPEPPVERV
jgi:hypothetical protein